jgi:hypothetical protein
MKKLLLLLVLFPGLLEAQTVRADRFTLNTGPCTMRSGIGVPAGGLGVVCDTYIDTASGVLWLKQLSGWVVSGVTGSGTVDVVAKWNTSTSIGNSTITDISGGNMTLAPAGDLITNPTGNDILPIQNYDINIGLPQLKYLSLSVGELIAETLVAQDVMATIGGRVLVGPTTLLTSDLSAGGVIITVKHNNLVSGDIVYLQSSPGGVPQVEFMQIVSGAGGSAGSYTYSVLRSIDPTAANQWYAGDAVFNTRQTGNGFIDLYSTRGVKSDTEVGPTVVGNVRLSSTYNDWSPRWAIGNLNGLYGYSGSAYGAAFGVPSSSRITIDSTNGVIIYGSDNDPKVTIDMSGNATFDGKLTVGTGRNLIRNSECRVSDDDWSPESNTGLTVTLDGPSFSPWRLLDESNACYLAVTGTPAAGTVTAARLTGQNFPVTPGLRYEMSAYVGNHGNTYVRAMILWYNATGPTLLSTSDGNQCTTAFAGGVELDDWCRTGIIGTAPAGADYAVAYIQTGHAGGVNDPFTFWVRSYFGEAGSAQEDLSEWGPAGLTSINGGMLETDSVTARIIAAGTITAAEIAAGTITATEIAVGSITADRLVAGTITGDIINGGTISGVTITAAGTVTLNGSGLTLASGTGGANQVKWSGGSTIHDSGGSMFINSDDVFIQLSGGGQTNIAGGKLNVEQNFEVGTTVRLVTLAGAGATAYVCTDNDGDIYSSSSSCDGLSPIAMMEMIQELQTEVATLKAETARRQQ